MLGASPFGVPVISPDQLNSLRPAARLGRGETRRVATLASRCRTWYLAASSQNRGSSSLSFSGYLAATLSNCVQSFVRSYSSYGKPADVGGNHRGALGGVAGCPKHRRFCSGL